MITKRVRIVYAFLFLFAFTFALSFTLASQAQAASDYCCIIDYCNGYPNSVGHTVKVPGQGWQCVLDMSHPCDVNNPC